jgi:hypothetical protein
MRLASFAIGPAKSWGVVMDDGIVEIGARAPPWPTFRAAIGADALGQVAELAAKHGPVIGDV